MVILQDDKEAFPLYEAAYIVSDNILKKYPFLKDLLEDLSDKMSAEDLADPQLLIESRTALDKLTSILNLGSVYPFQLT